jgi:hypothetical protein
MKQWGFFLPVGNLSTALRHFDTILTTSARSGDIVLWGILRSGGRS